jgi:hypothetical protein
MLIPPLSEVPFELLSKIIDELGYRSDDIDTLSVVDRAFTPLCQQRLFHTLKLSGSREDAQERLLELEELLEATPSLVAHFRCIDLDLDGPRFKSSDPTWIFNNPAFIAVIKALGCSPSPPDTLKINHDCSHSSLFNNQTLAMERLLQSFFSSSLTTLDVGGCLNLPPSIFLISPNLAHLRLDATYLAKGYKLSESPCYGRDPPQLDTFSFGLSPRAVKRLLKPIQTGKGHLVGWSKLRALRVSSEDWQSMPLVQRLLDSTSKTIEVIDFTLDGPPFCMFLAFNALRLRA